MLNATQIILVGSILVLLFFLAKAETLWDRLITLNLMTLKLAMVIIIFAVMSESSIMLDIAMIYSIIGFLAVSMLSRYILRGGRLK